MGYNPDVIPLGVWLPVARPCPFCGARCAAGTRAMIEGTREPSGRWVFTVVWEYSCWVCDGNAEHPVSR